jgi:hypothetical protein
MNYEYFLMRNNSLVTLKLYFPQYEKSAEPAKGPPRTRQLALKGVCVALHFPSANVLGVFVPLSALKGYPLRAKGFAHRSAQRAVGLQRANGFF